MGRQVRSKASFAVMNLIAASPEWLAERGKDGKNFRSDEEEYGAEGYGDGSDEGNYDGIVIFRPAGRSGKEPR